MSSELLFPLSAFSTKLLPARRVRCRKTSAPSSKTDRRYYCGRHMAMTVGLSSFAEEG